mmetsp:Transcript_30899/g.61454  ORF Transcript_30899/g.61454 Transcript_30899/m.61454 type:complete len:125 (+) Transcript_30899:475-849(+)|eukprot:CAMPEP_0170366344 /NCGR_PEP_ID=MMETSP0117_2-20130122/6368_1 /TAXON_ID=400756 /ORGANISM="Durinskia baltica, Strain CSIRO CS-38" /LENGTH=124 /DNA_ID=CAMNT_0010620927 /DNA_START=474 /DNA_END=848 /DNA_ORIENTATION=+
MTSVCIRRHKTFVNTKPKLQQSVTGNSNGTWYTDPAFKGITILNNVVPKPHGINTKQATMAARADAVHATTWTNRPRSMEAMRASIAGNASLIFTIARVDAEKATTPKLNGRKSDKRVACAAQM